MGLVEAQPAAVGLAENRRLVMNIDVRLDSCHCWREATAAARRRDLLAKKFTPGPASTNAG